MDFEIAREQWDRLVWDGHSGMGFPSTFPRSPGDADAKSAAEFLRRWADVLDGYFHAGDTVTFPATSAAEIISIPEKRP